MGKFRDLFKTSNNAQEEDGKKPLSKAKGKAVVLEFKDKHEPFGSLDVTKIKQTLEEEDFAQMQSLFFYMMRDLEISSSIQTRKEALLGLEYQITSDNQAFVDWANKLDFSDLITQASSAIYYGVSLSNVAYEVIDGKWVPTFNLVSPRFLNAKKGDKLKTTIEHLYIKQNGKKHFLNKLEQDRAVFHKHPIDIGEITDFSLASKLVWYFSLKHIALAHNLQYFDAVATPPLIAKTGGDAAEVVDTLYDIKSASVGVFGQDDIVEYLNVSSKADFLKFIEYVDSKITKTILGNTLSTGDGKTGSYSQSKVHENRLTEKLKFDAKLINKTISNYLSRLEALNFANAKGVKFTFTIKDKADIKELSETIKNLADGGYDVDEQEMSERFGFTITAKEAAKPTPTNQNNQLLGNSEQLPCGCGSCNSGVATAHNNEQVNKPKAVDYLDEQTNDTKAIEKALLNSIETALKDASNYEEAFDALLEQYQDMNIDHLEAQLLKAVSNAQILAATEIDNG